MESAISFNINQQSTLGILHRPESALSTAVLIVVGGPQYRVGSHRQFLQLSRFLATQNIISFRFDVRGMGDATGAKQPFEQLDDDIKAATDCLISQCPNVSKVVIWGLCDAASAALLYAHQDSRIAGLVLLNPWLRNEQAMAKTMVKFYYLQRLLSKAFWQKLLRGKVNVGGSLKEAKGMVSSSMQKDEQGDQSYQQGMLSGAQQFSGPVCLILSGNDLTAREFSEQTNANKKWQGIVKNNWQAHKLVDADHTFSSQGFKQKVEQITLQFLMENQ
ncbi:hydrolase 1, exosortase A system-associated [Paraglaciecola arctica]|uniref:Esterase/lipase/thioesterase family protein n=1 Tax=Paraglaciecola arctica BSs20135 TaxID=493475 RepID=K6XD45_9ALTE|nr:hydrolase 1, exosortase A system-associated [Paraglaciecola arctica]GAC18559.1 esterase/lipase/thioesterase family protein [Paraglaciecola arctica BSs20135]